MTDLQMYLDLNNGHKKIMVINKRGDNFYISLRAGNKYFTLFKTASLTEPEIFEYKDRIESILNIRIDSYKYIKTPRN